MPLTTPNALTLLRLVLIPVFVAAYYVPFSWSHAVTAGIFLLGALTDWLDGYLARRLDQQSPFGAFLDPVVDKLMVAAALVLLAADRRLTYLTDRRVFAVAVVIIIGREIAVSALREWMAAAGNRKSVAVSMVGKFKTAAQMVAILFLLYQRPLFGVPVRAIGEILLYLAAGLTLWSMVIYLRAAWPDLTGSRK